MDMFARCMAHQQGAEASVLVYGTESEADRDWLALRQGTQESLPLPPENERGAIEGHRDFHEPTLVVLG